MSGVSLDDSNFDKEVIESSELVLVDFWAVWCAPCRKLTPIIDELADAYQGKLKVAKVDVDQAHGTAARFGIKSVPTLILFKDGKVVEQLVGLQSKDVLQKVIDSQLA